MSAPDRSWTVAPTLLWFGAVLVGALWVLDGGVGALAGRLTAKRDPAAARPPGPTFTARPVVADSGDEPEPPPPLPPAPAGSHDAGALSDTCIEGTKDACKRWAMDAFYAAVSASKAGKLGRPVRVSWYGDSVVATDAIPGRLRAKLQAELGDGGPGFVYVIAPHRFCDNLALTRSSDGPWTTHAISTIQASDGLYGPAGSTTTGTEEATATIKLKDAAVTSVELYALGQPHGGTATVLADGSEILHVATAADAKQPVYAAAAVAGGARKLEIDTRGRVRLFGIDLENATGAVVDNLGIVNVNVKSFAANDPAHWSAELAHRGADLIMIMIGANEASWLKPGDQDTKDYQAHYEQVLAPIRKARPEATCLVVSPTDQAEAVDGEYHSRKVMPILVEAQRKAAIAQGCAFFSTYAWMGGRGSSAKWFRKGLVSSDFQHLTRKGANLMGDAVFEALMTGYQRYAAH